MPLHMSEMYVLGGTDGTFYEGQPHMAVHKAALTITNEDVQKINNVKAIILKELDKDGISVWDSPQGTFYIARKVDVEMVDRFNDRLNHPHQI